MRIVYSLIIAFTALLFTNCKKKEMVINNKESNNYVPGDLLVGIKSDITIDKVFRLFND